MWCWFNQVSFIGLDVDAEIENDNCFLQYEFLIIDEAHDYFEAIQWSMDWLMSVKCCYYAKLMGQQWAKAIKVFALFALLIRPILFLSDDLMARCNYAESILLKTALTFQTF